MEPFEIVMTIINTLAVVAIPIVSVCGGSSLTKSCGKTQR